MRHPNFVSRSVDSEDRYSIHIERHDLNIFTKYVNSRFAACWMRPSHVSPGSAARPPGAGPHCASNLDNLWLPDFCAPGYSPSQRRANVYKVQLNLVEKSMPLVLHKSLEGSIEPCSKSSVLEGFVAKRTPPPADPKRCSS